VFARRKPGVTLEAATADLSRAYQLSYKKSIDENHKRTPSAIAKPRAFVGHAHSAAAARSPYASRSAFPAGGC
jgi:hypothetical protein